MGIKGKLNIDLKALKPIKVITDKIKTPLILIYGKNDKVIPR